MKKAILVIILISIIGSVLFSKTYYERSFWQIGCSMVNAPGTSIQQFISMLDKINFGNLILLTDGGITCAELFFQAKKKGYTLIGRVRSNMNIVLNGAKVSLEELRDGFEGVHSVIAYVPEYRDWMKIVFDNRMETKMNEENKKGRATSRSDELSECEDTKLVVFQTR